jgi:hypothetical protein
MSSSSSSSATQPFWDIAFLKRFCQISHRVFTSLNFATKNFLQSKVVGLASNPQSGAPCPCVPPVTECPSYVYPQAPGSLFTALYDSQGYGGGILTTLHTRRKVYQVIKYYRVIILMFRITVII